MATAKELKELSVDELGRKATELREGLFNDRMKLRTGSLDRISDRTAKRKDLARVLTVMTQKNKAVAKA